MTDVTIKDVLTFASNQLTDFDTAKLDSEILLSSVINRGREFVYSHPEQKLNQTELADFHSLIAKRTSGFPVAYLTGLKEFWSLQIRVNLSTLIPRPETEHLVEVALGEIITHFDPSILDLGTGSGAIALAMAREKPRSAVIATDICTEALQMASANAHAYKLNNIRFLHSDWFSELGDYKFDLILCNPPYVNSSDPGFIHGEIRYEPRLALDGGSLGLDAFHRIVPTASRHINRGGKLILEHSYSQGESIRRLLQTYGYINVQTLTDYSSHDRITIASCP